MLSRSKRVLAIPFIAATVTWFFPSLVSAASEWPLNMPIGVTEVSREVYGLHMQILWWCVAIGVVVFGTMFYSMFAHRKSRGAKAANFHESTKLEIIWTVVPVIILIIMAVPATNTLVKIYDTDDADIDVLVTAYQWKWKYEYLDENGDNVSFFSVMNTPMAEIYNEIDKTDHYLLEVDEAMYLPVGKKVRFLVTAADVIHSWWVPDLAVKRDAIPGYIHEAWTRIDKEGTYRGQCAELCGKDHGFMPIVVEAVDEATYYAWLEGKRKIAKEIAEASKQTLSFEELYSKGEAVYTQNCAACHQAKGQGMPPTFPAIAGSELILKAPLNEHIGRVVNGGAGMPPFGEQLSPVDLAAVVTYQRNAFGNNMGDKVQPIDIVNFKQGQ